MKFLSRSAYEFSKRKKIFLFFTFFFVVKSILMKVKKISYLRKTIHSVCILFLYFTHSLHNNMYFNYEKPNIKKNLRLNFKNVEQKIFDSAEINLNSVELKKQINACAMTIKITVVSFLPIAKQLSKFQ